MYLTSCHAAPHTGAADLDMALIRHFAKEFDEKHMAGKGSVLDHPKAVAKLRKQVQHAPAPGLHRRQTATEA